MADCYPLFAAFLWKEKIVETEAILLHLKSIITTNIEKYPILTPPHWECVVHSSYNNKDIQINSDFIIETYKKYTNKFLEDFQLNKEELLYPLMYIKSNCQQLLAK